MSTRDSIIWISAVNSFHAFFHGLLLPVVFSGKAGAFICVIFMMWWTEGGRLLEKYIPFKLVSQLGVSVGSML